MRVIYTRGGGIIIDGDISRDEVSICVGRKTSIILMKLGVTQEDTLWLWLSACLV